MRKLLLSLLTLAASLPASTILGDTYIVNHADIPNGVNRNFGGDNQLYVDTAAMFWPTLYLGVSLVQPEVEPGGIINGAGTYSLRVNYPFGGGSGPIGLHKVLVPWAENSVTWNSFGMTWSSGTGVNFNGRAETTPFAVANGSGNAPGFRSSEWVTWTIPEAVLQGWADDPASNFGFMLYAPTGRDTIFFSDESAHPSRFDYSFTLANMNNNAVPEPALFPAIGAAVLVLGWRLRRR
jgi:hypothetical protein